jgi:hypothetical protein
MPRRVKAVKEDEILVELGVYANRDDASLANEVLTNFGIKAFFHEKAQQDEYGVVTTDPSGGTQLLVRAKDLAAARGQLRIETESLDAPAAYDDETKNDKGPVILRKYRDMPAAFVEKSALENAGIECFLQDDNVIRMDWLWSNAMGGIKLLVREKDAAEAEKLLSELAASNRDAADQS